MLSDSVVAQLSKDEATAQLEAKRRIINDIHIQAGNEGDWGKVSAVEGTLDQKLAAFNELVSERDMLTNHLTKLENAAIKGQINQAEYERAHGLRSDLGDAGAQSRATAHARGDLFNLAHYMKTNRDFRAFAENPQGTHQFTVPGLGIKAFRNMISTLDVAQTEYPTPYIVEQGLQPVRVADLLVQGETTAAVIKYLAETGFTNAAQETAEGDLKPLEDITYTPMTEDVATIADFIPVPKQTLADVPQIDTEFRGRLRYSVEYRLDRQILLGDGIDPNLKGIMLRTGVQTYARTTESNIDAILTGAAMVEGSEGEGFGNASAIVMHPKNWLKMRLYQGTAGPYLLGPINTPINKQIDGVPVVTTTAITQGTALVGDFMFATLLMREGLSVTMSTEHDDYFRRNLVALLAELRAAIKVTRPSAFCKVTNLE